MDPDLLRVALDILTGRIKLVSVREPPFTPLEQTLMFLEIVKIIESDEPRASAAECDAVFLQELGIKL